MTRSVLEPTTCKEAEPFALQVRDDSMTPEFWPGCVILVDPTGRATDGAFVLAELEQQFVFRVLSVDDGALVLTALNPRYKPVQIESISVITGVIVQRSGGRRRHHKRYDL